MRKKVKIISIIIRLIIIIILVISSIIAWNKFQEWIFFHPWNDIKSYRELQTIDEFKEITISKENNNLSGWFWDIQGNKKKMPLVIYFPGNAENSSNTVLRYYKSDHMKSVFGKYNLLVIDYPGYGMSSGKPSDDDMFIASNYIFQYASQMEEVDPNHIVIIGYSIGTGVASYCASTNEASALILVAPYDKALSLYNDQIDSFHGSSASLAKYSFDSAKYAENVIEPTLIFTSKADEVINYTHSLDLAGHFSELYDVVLLENVSHNEYFSQKIVLDGISKFLDKNL